MNDNNSALNKLPEITLLFWVMKISATTLGETAGDLFSMTLNLGYALSSIMLLAIFLVALTLQLRSRDYHPFLFWTVILATSTAGTTMSDFMDRTLGLGCASGSLILIVLLCSLLLLWRFTQPSLSVTQVRGLRAESLYWAVILVSNTLGTALGDYLADSSGLGFLGGALLISSLIALIVCAYYYTDISRVALFWLAFVLTRPLGATMGDFMTKPFEKGGLDLGTQGSSLVLLVILVGVVFYTYRSLKVQPA